MFTADLYCKIDGSLGFSTVDTVEKKTKNPQLIVSMLRIIAPRSRTTRFVSAPVPRR
jgi:hypothetical protein